MKWMAVWILAGCALVGWAGVSSSAPERPGGEIEGEWRISEGASLPITLRYAREETGQGRMRLRLGEDGEKFVGEYIRVGPRHTVAKLRRFYLGWSATSFDAVRTGPLGSPWAREEWSYEVFTKRLEGEVIATLAGDRGGRMRCRFQLADSRAGLAGGATGACQADSGDVVRFPGSREGAGGRSAGNNIDASEEGRGTFGPALD